MTSAGCLSARRRWANQFGHQVTIKEKERRIETAHYLNYIHRTVHPLLEPVIDQFSDETPPVYLVLGLVVNGMTGKLERVDVVCESGLPAFDEEVAAAVSTTSPLNLPTLGTLSGDGNFYVTWEVYSLPIYACSTYFALPLRFESAAE